jgi:hypothetical protein
MLPNGTSYPGNPDLAWPVEIQQVRAKAICCSHLYIKCIILPRSARDKHGESTQKKTVFLQIARKAYYTAITQTDAQVSKRLICDAT